VLQDLSGIEPTPQAERSRDSLKKPRFDDVPIFKDVVAGQITVIFKDEFRVRQAANKEQIIASDRNVEGAINAILRAHGAASATDFASGASEENAAESEKMAEAHWGADIPNLKSIFVLRFPDSANTVAIAGAIRRLEFVRTAYPTPKVETGATLVSQQTFSNMSGTKPNDGWFSGAEADYWHWFNRHKIFQAWSIMGTRTPYISVVDDGFDTSSSAWDRPNYYLTQARAFDSSGNSLGSDVTPNNIDAWSHGTKMAGIIGAKKNGANQYLCGVLPDANIVPVNRVLKKRSEAGLSAA
jgi:hypothetical protein